MTAFITKAELSICGRDQMAHEAQNIYSLALYRKKNVQIWRLTALAV